MGDVEEREDESALPSAALDQGLAKAFGGASPRVGESALGALERLTGVRSRIHLPEAEREEAPVVRMPESEDPELKDSDPRYEVLGEIARGGVGVVFRSRDKDLGRDVAIKVLRKDLAAVPEVVQRFVEEAQIGGQLQHPGVVPVYGLGVQTDGRPYFAMKLVKGRTLGALIRDGEDRTTLMSVFERVCQTVAYAHARHVIHRDLKPSNILVGAYGEVQVVDWGFAKVLAHGGAEDERVIDTPLPDLSIIETVRTKQTGSESRVGSLLGTPPYMPPEQARGDIDHLDERTDVFALGAVLCEILTGKPPYLGDGNQVVLQAARAELDDAYARLDACDADGELVDLAKHCLVASRQARPPNAGAVADVVGGWRRSLDERRRKAELDAEAARRTRKLTIALAASIVLALLAGGAGFFVVDRNERSRLDRANGIVETALREANLKYGEARAAPLEDRDAWNAAVAAARGANELVAQVGAGAPAGDATRTHLVQVEAAATAATAEATQRAELATFETELREACWRDFGWFKAHALEKEVVPVLAARDFDPFVSSPEDVAARIQASPLAEWIVRALDVWRVRRIGSKGDLAPLDAVLAKADPDPVRMRIRALLANRDGPGLQDLATEAEDLPGQTLSLLCDALRQLSVRNEALVVARIRSAKDPSDSDATYRLAQRLMSARPMRVDEAMRLFAEVRRQHPESGAVHHAIGWSELMRGNLADGVAELRKAHRLAPDVGAFRQLLVSNLTAVGTAHFNQGQYADAASVYRECAELAPEQARIHARLAQALIQVGRPGALKEASQAAERATELAPQDALTHSALAEVLRRTDDLEEALAAVDEARRLDPANGAYLWERGHILGRMGRVDEAVDALEAADGMSERAARFSLALLLLRLGNWEGAEAAVRQAMRLVPRKQVEIRGLLMRVQAAAGNRDGMRDTGEALLELERSESGVAGFRPALLIHQRIGGVAAWLWPAGEAKAWHEKTFPKCPPPHRAAFLCGLANERWLISADADEVLALLDDAHALAPSYAEAWLERGGVLQECGRLDEAMHAYAKAKQHGSHLFDPAIAWGKLLARRGRWDEALALFRETHEAIGWGEDWIARTERAKAIDGRFDDIVAGTFAPTDGEDARLFAEVALAHERYALAARLLEEHLAAIPAEPPWERVRKRREALFLATECGFRAAAGEGEDARSLSTEERDGLRVRAMGQARELLALLEEAPRYVEDWAHTHDLEYPRPLLVHPVYAPARADPAFRARLQTLWEKHR